MRLLSDWVGAHRRRAAVFFSIVLAASALVGCGGFQSFRQSASDSLGTGRTFQISGLEGRWTGDVTPLAADCGTPTQGSMTVSAHHFALDPFGSTFIVSGTVSEAGLFQGTLTRRVSAEGAKSVERSLTFTGNGQQQGDDEVNLVGQLVSGRCTWRVRLQRS